MRRRFGSSAPQFYLYTIWNGIIKLFVVLVPILYSDNKNENVHLQEGQLWPDVIKFPPTKPLLEGRNTLATLPRCSKVARHVTPWGRLWEFTPNGLYHRGCHPHTDPPGLPPPGWTPCPRLPRSPVWPYPWAPLLSGPWEFGTDHPTCPQLPPACPGLVPWIDTGSWPLVCPLAPHAHPY